MSAYFGVFIILIGDCLEDGVMIFGFFLWLFIVCGGFGRIWDIMYRLSLKFESCGLRGDFLEIESFGIVGLDKLFFILGFWRFLCLVDFGLDLMIFVYLLGGKIKEVIFWLNIKLGNFMY